MKESSCQAFLAESWNEKKKKQPETLYFSCMFSFNLRTWCNFTVFLKQKRSVLLSFPLWLIVLCFIQNFMPCTTGIYFGNPWGQNDSKHIAHSGLARPLKLCCSYCRPCSRMQSLVLSLVHCTAEKWCYDVMMMWWCSVLAFIRICTEKLGCISLKNMHLFSRSDSMW